MLPLFKLGLFCYFVSTPHTHICTLPIGVYLSDVPIVLSRFELLPTISADPHEVIGDPSSKGVNLSRSYSQPAIYLSKNSHHARLKSLQRDKQKHEDDLDIIKQIIEKDESLDEESAGHLGLNAQGRSLSLSHVNDFSSGSLPILPHEDTIQHVLKANYFSVPNISQMESPPNYENALHMPTTEHNHPLNHGSRSSSVGDFQIAYERDGSNLPISRTFSEQRPALQHSNSFLKDPGFGPQVHPSGPLDNYHHHHHLHQQKTNSEQIKPPSDFDFLTHRHSSPSTENLTDIPNEIHFEDIRSPAINLTNPVMTSSGFMSTPKGNIKPLHGLGSLAGTQSHVPVSGNLRNYLVGDCKLSKAQPGTAVTVVCITI